MPTDQQKRGEFTAYLKQLKQEGWSIDREAEITIIKAVLGHKGSMLDTYIAGFKNMIRNMKNDIRTEPDVYSKNPPADDKCLVFFVGANVTSQNYTSNHALRMFFSMAESRIYGFEVLR